MYSQHSSEKPVRNISRIKNLLTSRRTVSFKNVLKNASKHLRSAGITLMAIILFVGTVMSAYCLEGTGNVGFKPDFQSNKPSYSSKNDLFDTDENTVCVKLTVRGEKEFTADVSDITVGELIDSYAITLDENDVVNYRKDEKVFDGMNVTIDRITTETYTITNDIPYATITNESQTIPKGTTKVITEGVNGSKTETVKETYINGILTDTEVTQEALAEPVNEVVETGIGGVYTDKYGKSYEYSYYMDVTATAYGTLSGITATGKAIDFGMIAVDPRVIPLGTKVYLTGSTYGDMGVHSAEDTGGSIKGNKIDVYLGDDYNTLMQFGRRTMRIYILL